MSLTINQALINAKEILSGFATPTLDAEILLAHILNQPRTYLHAHPEITLLENSLAQFTQALTRRQQGEPIAYITGKKEFWSREFIVTNDVLIPRPDTECLIEEVLSLFANQTKDNLIVADLGTGSGIIAISLACERSAWQVHATDNSLAALTVARKNAQEFGLTNITFHRGNWCNALPSLLFDVIISNPPYIAEDEWAIYAEGLAFEPKHALTSGADGLKDLQKIISSARVFLKPQGYLVLEHGYAQGEAVRKLFTHANYSPIYSRKDLSNQERITIAKF